MSNHDNRPTDPLKQAERHAREGAPIPPEWLVEQIADLLVFDVHLLPKEKAHRILAKIAELGKLVARQTLEDLAGAVTGSGATHAEWVRIWRLIDAAPQWPEEKK